MSDRDEFWAWLVMIGYDDPIKLGRALAHSKLDLTATQLRTAWLVGQGLRNREIAARLDKDEETVRDCVSAILKRVGAKNRTELAVLVRPFVPPTSISAGNLRPEG